MKSEARSGGPDHEPAAIGQPVHGTVDMETLGALLELPLPFEGDLAAITFSTRALQEGEVLIRSGEECRNLYVVRFGSFKTCVADATGTTQGTAFPMRGDTIGVDGLASGRHNCGTTALERSDVVVLPARKLTSLALAHPAFANLVHRLMGREIVRDQALMFMLGSLGAEARVAAFLVDMSDRFSKLGYSGRVFNLRMTRQDLGHYLGLNIETVSRVMSHLSQMGLIAVRHREVEIVDEATLRRMVADPSVLHALRGRRGRTGRDWESRVPAPQPETDARPRELAVR